MSASSAKKQAAARKRRERLLARSRPSVVHHLKVDDDGAAQAELAAAKEALETAHFRVDEGAGQAVADAEARLAKARQAVQACYEPVTITALPPTAFERLAGEHPPAEDKKKDPQTGVLPWGETFPRALFLACVPRGEEELTVEEWEELLDGGVSQGEREALFNAALEVNARWPSGAVPND